MHEVSLVKIKKDEALALSILKALNDEYMESFMTLEEFGERHSISYEAILYVMKKYNLKKDMSLFNVSKRPEVIKKIAETKEERYGDPYYNNNEKNKKTCLERYGVEHVRQVDAINKKGQETFQKHFPEGSKELKDYLTYRQAARAEVISHMDFGQKIRDARKKHAEEDPTFLENIQNKRIKTTRSRFGVDNISSAEEIKEKKKETYLERYGVPNYTESPQFKDQYKNTCLSKYGVDHYSKTREYSLKRSHKWCVGKKLFDSKWEIYYYYYLMDNHIPFETQIPLNYCVDGVEHVYFCDFQRLDTGELIEIKNPALLDEDHNLKLLWGKNRTPDEVSLSEKLIKSKNICMKQNGVVILYDIDYFKDLEKQFKANHPDLKIKRGKEENENN